MIYKVQRSLSSETADLRTFSWPCSPENLSGSTLGLPLVGGGAPLLPRGETGRIKRLYEREVTEGLYVVFTFQKVEDETYLLPNDSHNVFHKRHTSTAVKKR